MNPGVCGFQTGAQKNNDPLVPCTEDLASHEEGFGAGSDSDSIHKKILHHLELELSGWSVKGDQVLLHVSPALWGHFFLLQAPPGF